MEDSLVGKKIGKLTVIKKDENSKRRSRYLCRCDCGKEKIILGQSLKSGNTKSCGCLISETTKQVHSTHGKSKTRLYCIYNNMKQRCYNPNNTRYKQYGGRGIKICDEWLDDFMNFYNWAMENGYQDNLTIDRIEGNDIYKPSNCRWVGNKTQQNNLRTNTYLKYNGETKTIAEWCRVLYLNYHTVVTRLSRGWKIERALSK